jgi:hypothetical protein
MKTRSTYSIFAAPIWVISALLASPSTHASTSFSSSATLSFTLNSITNLNAAHPNDLSALEIFASFQQASDPAYFYAITTGDALVVANNPAVTALPMTAGDTFNHTFAISGTASDGSIDSYHTGWFALSFNNTGSDSYRINLGLNYQLNADANALFSNTAVGLDYGYTGDTSAGSDSASAATFAGLSHASQTQVGITGWVLTLTPGTSTESVYADVVMTGNLQATTPVPAPAALWCFASSLLGLAGIAMKKRSLGAAR